MWRLSSAVSKRTPLGVSLTAWRTGKVKSTFVNGSVLQSE